MLARKGVDFAVLQHEIPVVKFPVLKHRCADPKGRTIGAIFRQTGQRIGHRIEKRALCHQILSLVAGQKHLGQGYEVSIFLFATLMGRDGFGRIACNIAHGRVQLAK